MLGALGFQQRYMIVRIWAVVKSETNSKHSSDLRSWQVRGTKEKLSPHSLQLLSRCFVVGLMLGMSVPGFHETARRTRALTFPEPIHLPLKPPRLDFSRPRSLRKAYLGSSIKKVDMARPETCLLICAKPLLNEVAASMREEATARSILDNPRGGVDRQRSKMPTQREKLTVCATGERDEIGLI